MATVLWFNVHNVFYAHRQTPFKHTHRQAWRHMAQSDTSCALPFVQSFSGSLMSRTLPWPQEDAHLLCILFLLSSLLTTVSLSDRLAGNEFGLTLCFTTSYEYILHGFALYADVFKAVLMCRYPYNRPSLNEIIQGELWSRIEKWCYPFDTMGS